LHGAADAGTLSTVHVRDRRWDVAVEVKLERGIPSRCAIVVASALLAASACGKSSAPAPPTTAPTGSAARDAAAPVPGIPHTGIASMPRADWPCRIVHTEPSIPMASRFEYGARTACVLPIDVVGRDGVVGCPDRMVEYNFENHHESPTVFRYDGRDRLIAYIKSPRADATTDFATHYEWDGQLVRRIVYLDRASPIEADGTAVVIRVGDEPDRFTTDDSGRFSKLVEQVNDSLRIDRTFVWSGTRLSEIDEGAEGTAPEALRVDYDCTKPPR
jgi:hypothetical protein